MTNEEKQSFCIVISQIYKKIDVFKNYAYLINILT